MRRDRPGSVPVTAGACRLVPVRAGVRAAALVTLVAAAGALSGCGALFGSRYNNFRAYYNTFYNANRAFDDGERALRRPGQRVDRSRFLPLFPSTQAGAAAVPGAGATAGPFQQAIDKSADLLRERPGSRYADDALLLIGKSYFYTANYVGAEQKFRETIDAATAARQRDLLDEARFWLGRTLAAQRRFDEGASTLEGAISDPEGSRRWRPRLRLALGALHADARRWEEAAATLAAALDEGGVGDELAARANFLRAQVLEAAGRHAEAAEAYGRVRSFSPPYELAYAAQLSRTLALGIGAGQHDVATAELRSMRRDGKNFANRAEVDLAYARVLAAGGQGPEAGDRFRAVLYDRTLEGGAFRGEALFRYAEYRRDVLADLLGAAAYFDSAATVARTEPGREELVTIAAITGTRRTADIYGAYAALAERLVRADSLLALGQLDDATFAQRIAAIESGRLIAWRAEQRRLARDRVASGFGDMPVAGGLDVGLPGGARPVTDGGDPPATAVPGTGVPPSGAAAASGFLAYLDIARVQAALLAFERAWGDRPLVPNWRRRTAIGGAMVAGPGAGPVGPEGLPTADAPPPLSLDEVPRTAEAQQAVRLERAAVRYEIGNVLFLSVGDPEAAAEWYQMVIDEDADAPVAIRALYALAELERSRGNAAQSEALYLRVLEGEPDAELAAQVRDRLGLAAEQVAGVGEALAADSAYGGGRRAWAAGAYAEAVGSLLSLAVTYPQTPAAPRALLGAGAAYTEWAHRDGLSLEAIPDSLVPPSLRDAAPPDTGRAPTPRTLTPDTPADSLGAVAGEERDPPTVRDPMDLLVAPTLPDSLAGAADTRDVAPAIAPGPFVGSGFGVADLYAVLVARYPGTPFADRASELRAALVDTGDTLPDSAGAPGARPPPAPSDARPGAAAASLMGEQPIDPALGGFTWRVARVPTPLGARALLRNFHRRGFRSAVNVDVASDGQSFYGVVVGQFDTLEDAEAARGSLPVGGLGADLAILPIESMVLIEEERLTGEGPAAVQD